MYPRQYFPSGITWIFSFKKGLEVLLTAIQERHSECRLAEITKTGQSWGFSKTRPKFGKPLTRFLYKRPCPRPHEHSELRTLTRVTHDALRVEAELSSLLGDGGCTHEQTHKHTHMEIHTPLHFTWAKQVKDTRKGKRKTLPLSWFCPDTAYRNSTFKNIPLPYPWRFSKLHLRAGRWVKLIQSAHVPQRVTCEERSFAQHVWLALQQLWLFRPHEASSAGSCRAQLRSRLLLFRGENNNQSLSSLTEFCYSSRKMGLNFVSSLVCSQSQHVWNHNSD